MRHNGGSVAVEPEQVESTQLAQQYETSLLSDQAVHDAADLSDGAAAATRDGNGAAAVRPEDPRRAAFVPSPMQLEFPLDMLPQAAPSGPRRSRRHCCALACCRGLSGAAMGLSVGVVLTFVVSSLELELDYAQVAAGFLGCWAVTMLLGAIAAIFCFLRCGRRQPPHQRRARPLPLTLTLAPALALALALPLSLTRILGAPAAAAVRAARVHGLAADAARRVLRGRHAVPEPALPGPTRRRAARAPAPRDPFAGAAPDRWAARGAAVVAAAAAGRLPSLAIARSG